MSSEDKQLGRYELVRLLGAGGMGEVHLAKVRGAAGFEKVVALKCLHSHLTGDRERTEGFLREAIIGVHLTHDAIVAVHDFGEEQGTYYIAMEYVRGYPLAQTLTFLQSRGGTMPVDIVVHIVRTIADALTYVHEFETESEESAGLIHGDVSPSNILLAADGRIKLADFGVAVVGGHGRGKRVAGKPAYLPPEVLGGAERSQSWDVYALTGVLLVALAGGEMDAKSVRRRVRRFQNGESNPFSVREHVPDALVDVLRNGLSRHIEKRYGTAVEFAHALDAAYPARVDDRRRHTAYVAQVFAHGDFVSEHGGLPTTCGFSSEINVAPYLAETAPAVDTTQNIQVDRALRFGLSPALGADRARAVGEAIAARVHQCLGREVTVVLLGDYRALADELSNGRIDFAWMPPFPFIEAWDRGARCMVAAQRQGVATYRSAIAVLTDSPIHSLEEIRGKSVAWVSKDSSGGYLFPAATLIDALGPLATNLSKQHFFGSYTAACEAVQNGWADAVGAYVQLDETGTIASAAWQDVGPLEAFRAVGLSPEIPGDNIASRPFLPANVFAQLATMFEGLVQDEHGRALLGLFNASAFVKADATVYEVVRDTKAKLATAE